MDYPALMDPQMQGILAAAFSGLQGSGPSLMPRSIGQIAGQAGQAGMGGYQQAMAQQMQAQKLAQEAQLQQMHGALYQQQAAKLAQHAALTKQFQESGALDQGSGADPARLRQMANLAMMNEYPGAAMLSGLADKAETKAENKAALAAMKSAEGRPGIVEMSGLTDSPHVGSAAKALQALINNGAPGFTPEMVQRHLDRLGTTHAAQAGMANRQDNAQGNRIEIRNMFPPQARASASGGAAEVTPGDYSKQGADFLQTLPEADRQLVKKIASYEIDPKTLSTKGGHRERALAMASQFDPTYDDTQYANKRRAITQFGSGPQGNTVRSLNVAIEHIDTLKRAADALKNGDFTPANKAYNEVAKVFGVTPPNTFEGIRDIVANEVTKGTIGNSGALADRQEAAAKVKAASSPQQLNELMNGWTELMGGQVKGLERQYESSTRNKDFRERYLTQRTRDAIATAERKAGASSAGVKRYNPATGKIE